MKHLVWLDHSNHSGERFKKGPIALHAIFAHMHDHDSEIELLETVQELESPVDSDYNVKSAWG